tara:strand:- start:112 stop:279 length:168 start_codon:yes stop_codon:yes gene_type:complete
VLSLDLDHISWRELATNLFFSRPPMILSMACSKQAVSTASSFFLAAMSAACAAEE